MVILLWLQNQINPFLFSGSVMSHHDDVIKRKHSPRYWPFDLRLKKRSITNVYSTVYSDTDQRKHQSSASLVFVRGILRWPVNSPHKGQWHGKCFHLMTSSWLYALVIFMKKSRFPCPIPVNFWHSRIVNIGMLNTEGHMPLVSLVIVKWYRPIRLGYTIVICRLRLWYMWFSVFSLYISSTI